MPGHHLAPQQRAERPAGGLTAAHRDGPVDHRTTAHAIEQAVLAVLAGSPLATVAAQTPVTEADLDNAVALYTTAGCAALDQQTAFRQWYQVHVEFADWSAAEQWVATHLWPRLRTAETDGIITSWWYIRKRPCWRLRFQPGGAGPATMQHLVGRMLDNLADHQSVSRWWPTIYEPETPAFGGPPGIAIAHNLFHADSDNILRYLSTTTPHPSARAAIGRREVSILLCSALLRSAKLDWHEQGDVWHRVTHMRPLLPSVDAGRLHPLTGKVHKLASLDTISPSSPIHSDSSLAFIRPWLAAFVHAGHALGKATHEGTLRRGLRDVLAHHVIFAWNRLGLSDATQAALSQAALNAILIPINPKARTDVDPA